MNRIGLGWIHLSENTVQWRAVVGMNLRVPENWRIPWQLRKLSASQEEFFFTVKVVELE
jgi:hypothetical protein